MLSLFKHTHTEKGDGRTRVDAEILTLTQEVENVVLPLLQHMFPPPLIQPKDPITLNAD